MDKVNNDDLMYQVHVSLGVVPNGVTVYITVQIHQNIVYLAVLSLFCPFILLQSAQCLKITQNVAVVFFNFGIFHQFLTY